VTEINEFIHRGTTLSNGVPLTCYTLLLPGLRNILEKLSGAWLPVRERLGTPGHCWRKDAEREHQSGVYIKVTQITSSFIGLT
jgi:hypothetical protein